jgi:hypothetical protein
LIFIFEFLGIDPMRFPTERGSKSGSDIPSPNNDARESSDEDGKF